MAGREAAAARCQAATAGLSGDPPPEMKPPTEKPVSWIHGLAVHEWAAAHDGLDTSLPTRLERLGRHAASPERPVKPDAANAPCGRLAHEVRSDGRMCGDKDAVHLTRNSPKTGIRARPLEFSRVGIDGDDLMPALAEATKDGVGGRATRARDPRDDDALTGEEISDG